MNTEELVRSEMLCFLQQKSNILAFDDLVTVCADFYSVDEVKMAASVLYKFVDQRPPAFKGSDKERKSTADMLKLILNPSVALPSFVATDISRLPPVGIDHVDSTAILQELSALRSEVRAFNAIRSEMEDLKEELKQYKLSVQSDMDVMRKDLQNLDFPLCTRVLRPEISRRKHAVMVVPGRLCHSRNMLVI